MLQEIRPVNNNGKINMFLAFTSSFLSLHDSWIVILFARFQMSEFTFK